MKNKYNLTLKMLLISLLITTSVTYAAPLNNPGNNNTENINGNNVDNNTPNNNDTNNNLTKLKLNKTLLIVDNDTATELPKRFRIIKALNISGSQQFTPSQLQNIIKTIDSNDLYIVDLRQEAHGFINDIAVSYHNDLSYPFTCYDSEETLNIEKILFKDIKKNEKINLYDILGLIKRTEVVNDINIEAEYCKSLNVKYKLFAVRDGSIPTPTMVDDFVNFINEKPEKAHLHFHCKEGQGRTTTFMAMYQMMNNTENLSLEEILQQQINAGGIDLTTNKSRADFLQQFYSYVKENKDSNYDIPYSLWIIKSNLAA